MDQIFLQNLYCWFFSELLGHACSAANKDRSTVNYHQSLAFDRLYSSCNYHCDRWLSQENFFFNIVFRSSSTQIFFKTGVVRNFAIFTEKHLCWSLLLIKRLYPKRDSTMVTSTEWKLRNFKNSCFYGTTPVAAFVNLIK